MATLNWTIFTLEKVKFKLRYDLQVGAGHPNGKRRSTIVDRGQFMKRA